MSDTQKGRISRRSALRKGGVVLAGGVLGPASASVAAADPVEISECTEISEPGEYVLTDDIDTEESCFELNGPDIVLDGNGHTLSGDGTGTGITGEENPVIRNLSIENFEVGCDVVGFETGEMTLENTTISNTSVGIGGAIQVAVNVSNSAIRDNRIGIGTAEAFQITITESVLSGNDVAVSTNREGNVMDLRDSTVRDNDNGVDAGIGRFVNNTIEGNDGYGIRLGGLEASGDYGPITIAGNEIRNNGGPGIRFTSGVGTVRENTISDNQSGVVITGDFFEGGLPPDYEITLNTIENNDEFGLKNDADTEYDGEIATVASCNYWGDPTGPAHPENPFEEPTGDAIDGDVEFIPWSVEPIRDGEATCIGGDPIGDFQRPPTDPDGDGLYEDINGDGEADIVDVQALFSNSGDEAIQNNPSAFDFNGDGSVNVVDVQKLFNEVST
jgi:parallel beta-helix repeat protein